MGVLCQQYPSSALGVCYKVIRSAICLAAMCRSSQIRYLGRTSGVKVITICYVIRRLKYADANHLYHLHHHRPTRGRYGDSMLRLARCGHNRCRLRWPETTHEFLGFCKATDLQHPQRHSFYASKTSLDQGNIRHRQPPGSAKGAK